MHPSRETLRLWPDMAIWTPLALVSAMVLAMVLAASGFAASGASAQPLVSANAEHRGARDGLAVSAVDLGTLGGRHSVAMAISGSVVVGWAQTSSGVRHAFAYDLSATTPHMVDLGTLVGTRASWAYGVDGHIVIGEASGVDEEGDFRPFVYDLEAPERGLENPLAAGGYEGSVHSVDHGVVVGEFVRGSSTLPEPSLVHAFTYDMAAADPVVHDLGTLPGKAQSSAEDLSGNLVVGTASDDEFEDSAAFVYDLADEAAGMRELLPGLPFSSAWEVEGSIAVGRVEVPRPNGLRVERPFWVDLAAPLPHPVVPNPRSCRLSAQWSPTDGHVVVLSGRHKESHGWRVFIGRPAQGSRLKPVARMTGAPNGGVASVTDEIAVGWTGSPVGSRAFAVDTHVGTPTMIDLGTARQALNGAANDVDGDKVVGWTKDRRGQHATVWTISRVSGATVRVSRPVVSAGEGTTAVITVRRAGPAASRATVSYRAVRMSRVFKGVSATRTDFRNSQGTLTFGPGQRVTTLKIPIVDDGIAEPTERFAVQFSEPHRATFVGTAVVGVTIPEN